MAAMSDYLEAGLLNQIFNGAAAVAPAEIWIALFTVPVNEDGSGGTEVSGGSYARQRVHDSGSGSTPRWTNAADNGSGGHKVENAHDVEWAQATANWGEVVSIGIYDADTGGNLLFHGNLATNKTVTDDDTFKFSVGNLVVNMA